MCESNKELLIRPTSKCIIQLTDKYADATEKILLVAGARGILNLPGGGIDKHETPEQALLRELQEEIGIIKGEHLTNVHEILGLEGETSSKEGEHRLSQWNIFRGKLIIPFEKITIPINSEITRLEFLTPEKCMQLEKTKLSALARLAIDSYFFDGIYSRK